MNGLTVAANSARDAAEELVRAMRCEKLSPALHRDLKEVVDVLLDIEHKLERLANRRATAKGGR